MIAIENVRLFKELQGVTVIIEALDQQTADKQILGVIAVRLRPSPGAGRSSKTPPAVRADAGILELTVMVHRCGGGWSYRETASSFEIPDSSWAASAVGRVEIETDGFTSSTR